MRRLLLAVALSALLAPAVARALPDVWVDPTDGMFDIDRWLARQYGFVPVISPVTEPAVGFGLAGGLVFLHGPLAGEKDEEGRVLPPAVSAAVGMYTSNGSWAAGGAHHGHSFGGRLRYQALAGYGSLQLASYGSNGQEHKFGLDVVPVVLDLTVRLGPTELFAGAAYTFLGSQVHAQGESLAALPAADLDTRLSGLGPVLRWDTRDSIFSPSRGVRAEATATWYAPWLGSDRDGWLASVQQVSYAQLTPWLVGALRLDAQFSGGDLPFWDRPYITLRGIPALRYQGRSVMVAETEERFDLGTRWSIVAFAGAGTAAAVPKPQDAWNVGSGFRYLLARQFNIRMGIDVARGPEQWAGYVIFGNAWL